jgi:hypothetical protein
MGIIFSNCHYGQRYWKADLPSSQATLKLHAYQKVDRKIHFPLFELRIVINDQLGCNGIAVKQFNGKIKFVLSNGNIVEAPLTLEEHRGLTPKEYRGFVPPSGEKVFFFGIWRGHRHDARDAVYAYCAAHLSYPQKPEIIQKSIKELHYSISLSMTPPEYNPIEFVSEGKMELGLWELPNGK